MSGVWENNVVILHNVNAFGENRNDPPKYEAVFGFSAKSMNDWTEDYLSIVFAIGNGQPADAWQREVSTDYYAQGIRSLSVSDVVVLNGIPYRCDPYGWTKTGPTAAPPTKGD